MAMCTFGLAIFVILVVNIQGNEKVAHESRLRSDLFSDKDALKSVPPYSESGKLEVKMLVALVDIIKANEDTNEVDVLAWLVLLWQDNRLAWNLEDYGNITDIRVDPTTLWMPDIDLYMQTAVTEMIYNNVQLVLDHTGTITFLPGQKIRSACDLEDVDRRSGATCVLAFGSWTYSSYGLDLDFLGPPELDITNLFEYGSYELIKHSAKKIQKLYSCCPEPTDQLVYTITFKEK